MGRVQLHSFQLHSSCKHQTASNFSSLSKFFALFQLLSIFVLFSATVSLNFGFTLSSHFFFISNLSNSHSLHFLILLLLFCILIIAWPSFFYSWCKFLRIRVISVFMQIPPEEGHISPPLPVQ